MSPPCAAALVSPRTHARAGQDRRPRATRGKAARASPPAPARRRPGRAWLGGSAWALLAAALVSPATAQLQTFLGPRGIDREEVVAAPPGGSALMYTVGLRGQTNPARLTRIDLRLSPLAAPLVAGLTWSDLVALHLIESANQRLGDGDDVVLSTVPTSAVDLAGGVTAVGDGGQATVLCSRYPQASRSRVYFVVAELAASA